MVIHSFHSVSNFGDVKEEFAFHQRGESSLPSPSNGDLRLVSAAEDSLSPSTTPSGRLEVHMNTLLLKLGDNNSDEGSAEPDSTGAWGSVCGRDFTLTEASVACRQLGFVSALSFELSSSVG